MTFSVIGKGHAPSSEGPPIPWPPSYRQKATPSRSFYACLPGPGVPAWVSEPPYGFLSYGSLPGFLGPDFPAWLPGAKTSCLASWARTFPPGFLGPDLYFLPDYVRTSCLARFMAYSSYVYSSYYRVTAYQT